MHKLDEKGGSTNETAFSIQTDREGFSHSLKPVFRNDDLVREETLRTMEEGVGRSWEKLKGKRASTWIYLAIPKVGAILTRRFFLGRWRTACKGRTVKEKQFLFAYRFVQIPSPAISIQLSGPKGTLEGSPQSLSETSPLAEVKLAMPCWQDDFSIRTDAGGSFQAEGIPVSDGVPLLIRLLHRDGIATVYNPPKVWRYP